MSIIAQNNTNEIALLDCIQRFFSKHHIGKLLAKCNGTKEKGVPAISLLRYKLGNVFRRAKHVYAAAHWILQGRIL